MQGENIAVKLNDAGEEFGTLLDFGGSWSVCPLEETGPCFLRYLDYTTRLTTKSKVRY